MPNIDVSGWVADVGIASVWLTKAEERSPASDDPVAKANRPRTVDEYFRASAPDEDLLGHIDAFRLRQQWAEQPGRLSEAMRRYYMGGAGSRGVESRYASFCAAAGIRYQNSGGTITLDPSQRAALIGEIDRFNDLFGAGTGGAIWGKLFGPAHRAWPHTPAMLDKFLAWLKPRLEAELRSTPAGSGR